MKNGEWKTMERLTYRLADGSANLNGFPEKDRTELLENAFEHLAAFEDKLERGEMVEVVRCKYCENNAWQNSNGDVLCEKLDRMMMGNCFCGFGKRREAT